MKHTLFILLILLVAACDPNRRINMINRTNEDVEFTWKIKEDSIKQSPLFMSNSATVHFTLKNKKPSNRISMSAGVGNWTKTELEQFTNDLESMEIKWRNESIKLDTCTKIMDYLVLRRKGVGHRKINLVIK